MTAPARVHAGDTSIEIAERPLLMGIVNANHDSFSDAGPHVGLGAQIDRAMALVRDGADILDIGGESASPDTPQLDPADEIDRVVPLIEAVVDRSPATVISVDTYKPAVAAAAVWAGAKIINDISGLRDPEMASLAARSRAALVLMHNAGVPKRRLLDPELYGDVTGEVLEFLRERLCEATTLGVPEEQIIIDPGPDFSKTPAQTVELLRNLPALAQLGRPILLPVSRKDFIGVITGRSPRNRLAGTLAAVAHGVDHGAHILRVHDVAATRDFLAVRSAVGRGDRAR